MAQTPISICLVQDSTALRVVLREPGGPLAQGTATGIIDVGESGRLLGIEVESSSQEGPLHIDIDQPVGHLSRSAETTLTIETGHSGTVAAVIVPRRGAGYEITYPSGNQ